MKHEYFSCIYILIILVLMSGVSLFSQSLAEENVVEKSPRDNSLHAGSWSFQFQLEDDIGLKPFNSMIISFKRHTSRHSAFRVGLDLDIDFDDSDYDTRIEESDTNITIGEERVDKNSQRIELDLEYLNYPNAGSNINMFWGVGPLISYSRSRQERERIYSYDSGVSITTGDRYSSSWSLGVLGMAGVEWFATRSISFHAEYRASAAYYRSKIEQVDVDYNDQIRRIEAETFRDGWDFHGVKVIMGISLYF
ncbi:hypothetical protein KAX02_08460 [candidate division WOR-3 bacterium]|nr:hypothetical protein [candidate division WOR-3 bacterium]